MRILGRNRFSFCYKKNDILSKHIIDIKGIHSLLIHVLNTNHKSNYN